MASENIFDKVVALVRMNFPACGALSAELRTADIAGWDSFGTMQMVMDVEQTFGIEIPITMIPQLDTLGKIVDYVAALTGSRGAA